MRTAKRTTTIFFTVMMVFLPCGLLPLRVSATEKVAPERNDSQIQAAVAKSLDKPQFKHLQATVNSGIVTLTGVVDSFAYKAEAERRAHRIKDAVAVRNNVTVGGPRVDDRQLQENLVQKLEYDRVGYGTTAFNAISVAVRDGVVTLGGHAYGPTDKDSAISVASYTPGVKDLIDEIAVDPVSLMDDRIRIAVARAIYRSSSLSRYALDPGRPIRISVQNGHVTLYGVVDNKMDQNLAYLKANGVPGIFTVTNELQVAGGEPAGEK